MLTLPTVGHMYNRTRQCPLLSPMICCFSLIDADVTCDYQNTIRHKSEIEDDFNERFPNKLLSICVFSILDLLILHVNILGLYTFIIPVIMV